MNKTTFFSLCAAMCSASLFADDAAPAKEQNFPQMLIMIGLALVFFYFILWRPEQKRRKAMEAQRSALKVGDRVTAMGIVGTIGEMRDNTVILKMFDGAKIEMLKAAITEVKSDQEEVKK